MTVHEALDIFLDIESYSTNFHDDDTEALRVAIDLFKKFASGKLIELPCKVGDTVYHILGLNEEKIKKAKVTNLEYNLKYNEWIVFFDYLDGVLGKTVFLTREEAEKKLEEWKNEISNAEH